MLNIKLKSYSYSLSVVSFTTTLLVAICLSACSPDKAKEIENNKTVETSTATIGNQVKAIQRNNHDEKNAEIESEVTVLRLSHFLPATSYVNQEVLIPWTKKIEQESEGRLKIEIYPSAQLTKPSLTYDSVMKGTVDIGLQLHGTANGRFPLAEMSELPGISSSASQSSCLLQTLYDDGTLAVEYQDTHVLTVFGTGYGLIHTKDKLVRTPDDIKGLRIRRPSAVPAAILESMGALPVGIPPTDIYTSLQRGVIDGVATTWDGYEIFRLQKLSNTHTHMPFYTTSMVLTMNKEVFNRLPKDLQAVIDRNSGMALATKMGEVIDKHWQQGYQSAKEKGDEIIIIPDPLNDPNWSKPLKEGTQRYLDLVTEKGLNAEAIYAETLKVAKACK